MLLRVHGNPGTLPSFACGLNGCFFLFFFLFIRWQRIGSLRGAHNFISHLIGFPLVYVAGSANP